MILSEYIFRAKKTQPILASECLISERSIANYSSRIRSPGLLNALKMYASSGGSVSFVEMLSKKDLEELQTVLRRIRCIKNRNCEPNTDVIDLMEKLIDEARKGSAI